MQAGRLSLEEVLDLLDALDRLRAYDQQTIRANLPEFTFASVVTEVHWWMDEGTSLFDQLWESLIQADPATAPNTS